MLFRKFLELRTMFFLLFALASTLILLVFAHKLSQELVSLRRCVVVDALALLNDPDTICVSLGLTNRKRGITAFVTIKCTNFGVLDNIL